MASLLLLLSSCLLFLTLVRARLPFDPRDILPALPHEITWPVLNALSNPTDLMPEYVASISSQSETVSWTGTCFSENTAYIEYTQEGAVLHIETSKGLSLTCMDLYVFATPYRVTWDYYLTARKHTLKIDNWEDEVELKYVKNHGISIFLMPAGMLGTLKSLWDVLPLFSNSAWGEKSNIDFLEKHMETKFVKRMEPWVSNFSTDDIRSGDFLVLSKIRGRWGAFETLEKWVTGAYAGHTAVCLRDEEGKLWVGESGYENENGEEIIAMINWEDWWARQISDDANSHVSLLPLHPDVRAKFNVTAAWEYARSMVGNPYGYHNMIFSWIDTPTANFPPPLDGHLVMSVMTMWTRIQPSYASNMWNEALNKRLGTKDLDMPAILLETQRQGLSFEELLSLPEKDEWIYSDGKSTTCVSFILSVYKAAGLFGPLSESVQVTEFTIRDAYMLRFFENNATNLPAWCNSNSGNDVPLLFCQILGEYQMELPGYNTIDPYAHMNEACPSLPPDYERPLSC